MVSTALKKQQGKEKHYIWPHELVPMCELCSVHEQCQYFFFSFKHTRNSTIMIPPVARICCDCGVAIVTDTGLTTCFLLPADSEEEVEGGVGKGDREAVGHLTPLTISGKSKS